MTRRDVTLVMGIKQSCRENSYFYKYVEQRDLMARSVHFQSVSSRFSVYYLLLILIVYRNYGVAQKNKRSYAYGYVLYSTNNFVKWCQTLFRQ